MKTSKQAAAELAAITRGRTLQDLGNSDFMSIADDLERIIHSTEGPIIEEDIAEACKTYRLMSGDHAP